MLYNVQQNEPLACTIERKGISARKMASDGAALTAIVQAMSDDDKEYAYALVQSLALFYNTRYGYKIILTK